MAAAAGIVQSSVSHYQVEDFFLKMAKKMVETSSGSGSNERLPSKYQRLKDFIRAKMNGSGSTERLPLKDLVSQNLKGKAVPFLTLASTATYGLYCLTIIRKFDKCVDSTTIKKESFSAIANENRIDRTDEKARIRQLIMSPFPPSSSNFHVYVGPHRAGKSRAVMEVVDELRKEGVKGVQYVLAGRPLYRCLAEAFCMNHPSVMNGGLWAELLRRDPFPKEQTPDISLRQVTDRLAKSAKKYADGRVTTIIVDGINRLVPIPPSHLQGPETLELRELIEIAKDHADDGVIHWILVDSSGVALDVMNATSGSSRLELVFSRDVSEKEAKEFLKKRFEAAGKKIDADEVYKCVTGGRIGLLTKVAKAVREKPKSTSSLEEKEGGGVKAALKRLFGIAAPPPPAREGATTDVAEAITSKEELFKSVFLAPKEDLTKIFSIWPFPKTSAEEFQYRILRLLAENPKGFEDTSSLRRRAGEKEFYAKGVNCDTAMRQLLKSDLLRYVNLGEVALHSNAVKYIVLNEGDPLKSGDSDDDERN